MTASVSGVYLQVVDDVVSKLRKEFIDKAVKDSVLSELQMLWELKMMRCGAIQGPIERNSVSRGSIVPTPVHDLNVPCEGTEEYQTPTAEMLFPQTPLQTPVQTPLPVEPGGDQNLPGGYAEYGTISDSGPAAYMKSERPGPYMNPPSPWLNQRPLGVDVNVAYEEAREEDGGISQPEPPMKDFFMTTSGKRKREEYPPHFLPNGHIPQQDGSGDVSLDPSSQETGVHTEDYNTPSYYVAGNEVGTPKPTKAEALEDDEPPLKADDDDELDDLGQVDEETFINHLVFAKFEKACITKSRWKCILKGGLMYLNNKDILFTKAIREFDF